jgi:hypothetical protein
MNPRFKKRERYAAFGLRQRLDSERDTGINFKNHRDRNRNQESKQGKKEVLKGVTKKYAFPRGASVCGIVLRTVLMPAWGSGWFFIRSSFPPARS